MKKILSILFSFFVLTVGVSYAEDGDIWDNYGDQNFYGNSKAVSDEEFDKALESKMKKKKKKNKNIPKGSEFHQANETQSINEAGEELNILCVPVNIALRDSRFIPVGHYNVIGEKKDGRISLKLYQAHSLIGEMPAIETDDDFNQDTVNFVKIIEDKDNKLKLIYGSIDFNAYSIIDVAE